MDAWNEGCNDALMMNILVSGSDPDAPNAHHLLSPPSHKSLLSLPHRLLRFHSLSCFLVSLGGRTDLCRERALECHLAKSLYAGPAQHIPVY